MSAGESSIDIGRTQLRSVPSMPPSSSSNACETRDTLIELEYEYLTESSFHTDHLRNQFIQFYLLIVGVAVTAIAGVTQVRGTPSEPGNGMLPIPLWALSVVAYFIGTSGLVLIPIFARLRCVVLECIFGTVLLKAYILKKIETSEGDRQFAFAFLWDAGSAPQDEHYFTASFLLIFLFMLLDSVMFSLGSLILLIKYAQILELEAVLRSLDVGIVLLTFQVIWYRVMVGARIKKLMHGDEGAQHPKVQGRYGLKDKWKEFDLKPELKDPVLLRPILIALDMGTLLGALVGVVISRMAHS